MYFCFWLRKSLVDAVEQVNIIYSNAAALPSPLCRPCWGGICCLLLRLCHCGQLVLRSLDPCKRLPAGVCLGWNGASLPSSTRSLAAPVLYCTCCTSAACPDHRVHEQCVGNMIGPMGLSCLQAWPLRKCPEKVFCTRAPFAGIFVCFLPGVPLVNVLLLAVHASLFDPGRQVHPDDGLPSPLPRLCNGHLHGTAL